MLNPEEFDRIVASDNLSYYKGYSTTKVDFKEIEKEISPTLTYKVRRDDITKKLENKKEVNSNEIAKLNYQIINLKNSSLHELIVQSERAKVEEYFNQNIIKSIPDIDIRDDYKRQKEIERTIQGYNLLKVLISNNYIDENYSNYISLFYPESISEKDNNLKLRIIQNGATEFNENIDKIRNFISELSINNFKKESILNFYILDYLLDNYDFNSNVKNKLDEFINTLKNEKDKSVDFIQKYIDYSEISGKAVVFIKRIAQWDGFWSLVFNNEKFSNDKKKLILDKIISYIDINQIRSLNKDKKINAFLNNYDDFFINNSEKLNKEDIVNKLKILDIKFNKIKFDNSIQDILSEINKNNLYKINPTNVNLFLSRLNTNEIPDLDYNTANYSFLLKSNVNHLKENIKNNINEYVEQVLLKLENNNFEEDNVVKELINNENINNENVELLIEKLNFSIADISEIDNNMFWTSLVIFERMQPNWKNVLLYYKRESEKIDSIFTEYLDKESNFKTLSTNCIDSFLEELGDDEKENLELSSETIDIFNISLVNSEISVESLTELSKSMTKTFEDVKIISLENRLNGKLEVLINADLIVFNEKNLNNISGRELELFVEKNEEDLENHYNSLNLPISQWDTIFKSDINGSLKKEIFEYLNENQLYNQDDTNFLVTIFKNFHDSKFYLFSTYFTENFLKSDISVDMKINLLNLEKNNVGKSELVEYLEFLGFPFSLIIKKEKIEVPNNNINSEFLDILQKNALIKRTYLKENNSLLTVSYHQ